MFNNYKKNKSKKSPKTKLPKYERGGGTTTRAGGDSSRTMYGTEAGDYGSTSTTGQGGDATSNLYNEKRNSNISSDQWAAVAKGVASTGAAFSANQSLTGDAKSQADYNAINSGIDSVAGAVTPWYTYAKAGSDMGRGMVARDENGVPVDKTNAQMDAVMKPHHEMITEDLSKGNTGLAIAELLMPGIGYESRSNSLGLGSTINKTLGVKNTEYTYAMGGMNMQPNAEVEKQENTLNPDGTTTQFNGPTHEQGGIPTQLDPGTLIFSDKLKHSGKTFAQLNKANQTDREDKILNDPSAKKDVKDVANALKAKKINNSLSLFKIQEEMKQSRIDNYTKRLGGIQKYSNGGITPEQYKQAQSDSLTLYNAGLKSNKIPYYEQPNVIPAMQRLQDVNSSPGRIVAPAAIKGQAYGNSPGYTGGYNVEFQKPTMLPYREAQITPEAKVGIVNHPNYNQYVPGIEKSRQPIQTTTFKHGGQVPRYDDGGESWMDRNSDSLYQAGFGLAQNAGQLSYLMGEGKKYDTQEFYNYNPNTLDPTMDLHDAQMQNNRAEYNVRGASGGNAGTYLSNRVALNAQNTMNKSRIHQAYENANTGIKNQAKQYNIGNKYATDDINARNKGAALTNYYKTIGSMGTNVAQGMKDNRQMGMDEESIQLMSEFYNSPEAQKMFAKYKKDKSTKPKKD